MGFRCLRFLRTSTSRMSQPVCRVLGQPVRPNYKSVGLGLCLASLLFPSLFVVVMFYRSTIIMSCQGPTLSLRAMLRLCLTLA